MPVLKFCRSQGVLWPHLVFTALGFEAASCLPSWPLVNALTLRVCLDPVDFFFHFHLCPLEDSSFLVFKMVVVGGPGYGKHFVVVVVVVVERKC